MNDPLASINDNANMGRPDSGGPFLLVLPRAIAFGLSGTVRIPATHSKWAPPKTSYLLDSQGLPVVPRDMAQRFRGRRFLLPGRALPPTHVATPSYAASFPPPAARHPQVCRASSSLLLIVETLIILNLQQMPNRNPRLGTRHAEKLSPSICMGWSLHFRISRDSPAPSPSSA